MRIILTGGAGFIGTNAAAAFAARGHDVLVVDNLSRRGTATNLEWLREEFQRLGRKLDFVPADIRDYPALLDLFREFPAEAVVHLAAQVAVTTSVQAPREDFELNAAGTLNVLEAVRNSGRKPLVIYSSTNKVYGGMEAIEIELGAGLTPDEPEGRYRYASLPGGISETQGLDFHSPYGCSKGAADQYVRDYARIYGLRTVVFRQSCIYGPRQFGIEDQGWVAWFVISAALGHALHLYGDGKQVRDLLHVDDLISAYLIAIERREQMTGKIYNVGGGAKFSLSIIGLLHMLERLQGKKTVFDFGPWRPGDQPVYISDVSLAARELGWRPRIDPETGVHTLLQWVEANQCVIRSELGDLLK